LAACCCCLAVLPLNGGQDAGEEVIFLAVRCAVLLSSPLTEAKMQERRSFSWQYAGTVLLKSDEEVGLVDKTQSCRQDRSRQ
jgi:hypothetical protein